MQQQQSSEVTCLDVKAKRSQWMSTL